MDGSGFCNFARVTLVVVRGRLFCAALHFSPSLFRTCYCRCSGRLVWALSFQAPPRSVCQYLGRCLMPLCVYRVSPPPDLWPACLVALPLGPQPLLRSLCFHGLVDPIDVCLPSPPGSNVLFIILSPLRSVTV